MRTAWEMVSKAVLLLFVSLSVSLPVQAASPGVDVLRRLSELSAARHMEALISGARTEGGRVVWYAGRALEEVTKLEAAFKVKYPFMNVDFVRVAEGTAERVLAEFRAGVATADVVDINAAEIYILQQAGALAAYKSPEAEKIPGTFKDKDGYWVAMDVLPEMIAYNTKFVSPLQPLPRTFQDLANPIWKGRLGRTTIGGPRWIAGMVSFYGERRGLELVRAIARNNVRLYTSNTGLGVQLSIGEISLAFDLHITVPVREKGRGAPVEFYANDDVLFLDPSMVAITAATRRPLGAALLVTWLLSQEGQKSTAEITGGARMSTRSEVPYEYSKLLAGRKTVIYGPDLVGRDFVKFQTLFREIFIP